MIIDFNNLSIEDLKKMDSLLIQIQPEFNEVTNKIYKNLNNDIGAKISNITSRNNHQSGLFKSCLILEFISQKVKDENSIEKIILKDNKLIKILSNKYKHIKFTYKIDFFEEIKNQIRPLKDLINNFLIFFKMYFSRDLKRLNNINFDNKNILIDTFILNDTISNKAYIDRYYTNILNFVSDDIKNNIYFIPSIQCNYNKKILNQINKNSNENLIFKSDFLSFRDYLLSFFSQFSQKYKPSKIIFSNFNINSLIINEFKTNKFNTSAFEGLLNYHFIKKLRKHNFQIKLFINWFENQLIDRGFNLGINEFFPTTICKGYQGFIIDNKYSFHLCPTKFESDMGFIPKQIIVTGDKLKSGLSRFFKNLDVKTGPAFRYHNGINFNKKIGNKNTILVILSIDLQESIKLCGRLFEISKLYNLNSLNFFIKPHPVNSLKFKKYFKSINIYNFKIIDIPFKQIINNVDLVIGNGSSSLVESLLYKKPVIVTSDGKNLLQNPIPNGINKKIYSVCYDNVDIYKKIKYFLNFSEKEILRLTNSLEQDFFIMPTSDNVNKLLETN